MILLKKVWISVEKVYFCGMKSTVYISRDTLTGVVRVFGTLSEAAEAYGGSHQGVAQAVKFGRNTFGCSWQKGRRFFAVKAPDKEYLLCTKEGEWYIPMSSHERIREGDALGVKDVTLSMYM